MVKKFFTLFLLSCTSLAFTQDAPINKAITPSARTCTEMNGVYFTGDFIYWKAREDELAYAGTLNSQQSASGTDNAFKIFEVDFQYDPGFKVGLGGNLPYDGWDLYLNWTHLHTHPTSSLTSDNRNIVAFFIGNLNSTDDFVGDKASGSWNLMFNMLDFDWGRRFFLSETLTMRPSFGGKVAWIHQKIRYKLVGVERRGVGTPLDNQFFHWNNDFWGIGPYLAMNVKWTFIWGFGIYGELSGALLWGEFKQRVKSLSHQIDDQSNQVITVRDRVQHDTHRVRPTLKAFVGLDWERCIIPKWLSLNFRIGYETQYFWSQLVNHPGQEPSGADLTFEGLTFTGRLDF